MIVETLREPSPRSGAKAAAFFAGACRLADLGIQNAMSKVELHFAERPIYLGREAQLAVLSYPACVHLGGSLVWVGARR